MWILSSSHQYGWNIQFLGQKECVRNSSPCVKGANVTGAMLRAPMVKIAGVPKLKAICNYDTTLHLETSLMKL